MSGEYQVHLATGLTVYALVFDENRTKLWDGSAFTTISSIADADWADGKVTCTEQTTSDATGTGLYVGERPAEITTGGRYLVEFYSGTPTPGLQNLAIQFDDYTGYAYSVPSPTSFVGLKVIVADFLGWGRNTEGAGSAWSTETAARLSGIILTGLRRVYYPDLVAKSGVVHEWSFLKIDETLTSSEPYDTGTVTIVAGVVTLVGGTWPAWAAQGELEVDGDYYTVASRDGDTQITLNDTTLAADALTTYTLIRLAYDLPDDFDSMRSEFSYAVGHAEYYPPLKRTTLQDLRQKRRHNKETSYPTHCAIRPKTFVAATGQRWEILLQPPADAAYTWEYEYKAHVSFSTEADVYFRGGNAIAELIEESCLAVAEQRFREDGGREHTDLFMMRLAAAVDADRNNASPETLGPDNGGELTEMPAVLNSVTVTIDDVEM